MRIYLVGFMGCGKSTVGRSLAKELDWDFVDLDREIQRRANMTIPEIFEAHGEQGFREREHECLLETGHRVRTVLATGGGAFTREENIAVIAKSGVSVWLDPAFEVLLQRLLRSVRDRPMFRNEDQLRELWQQRLGWYERADLHIPVTEHDNAETVTAKIVARLKDAPCVT